MPLLQIVLKNGLECKSEPLRQTVERFFRVCCQHQLPGFGSMVASELFGRLDKCLSAEIEYFNLLAFVTTANQELFKTPEDNDQHFCPNQIVH